MKISKINFGKIDGQNESREPNFSEMFYDGNGHFDALLNTRKFLVVGRKGTGKTTLAEYFIVKGKEKGFVSKILRSSDYFLKKLNEFQNSPVSKEEEVLFWKYVFLNELAFMCIDHAERAPFWNIRLKYKAKKLKRFLNNPSMTTTESEVEELSSVSLAGGVSTGDC